MELVLSGSLNVARMADIREKLMESINRDEVTTIRIENGVEIDISLLQLLCSGHRTAAGAGRRLELLREDPPRFNAQLREAGFLRHTGCVLDCDRSCLWVDSVDRHHFQK